MDVRFIIEPTTQIPPRSAEQREDGRSTSNSVLAYRLGYSPMPVLSPSSQGQQLGSPQDREEENLDNRSSVLPTPSTDKTKDLASSAGESSQRPPVPTHNSLVYAALHASHTAGKLLLRPDDIWTAIMMQLSFHLRALPATVNPRQVLTQGRETAQPGESKPVKSSRTLVCCVSPDLRSCHDSYILDLAATPSLIEDLRKELAFRAESSLGTDFMELVQTKFSTTTNDDLVSVLAAFLGSGTHESIVDDFRMQIAALDRQCRHKYNFTYAPSTIILKGSPEDWVALRSRAQRLAQYGAEARRFLSLLEPILERFVQAIIVPNETFETRNFFDSICYAGGKPIDHFAWITGWITAFCFWDKTGKTSHREYSDDTVNVRGSRKRRRDDEVVPYEFPLQIDGRLYPYLKLSNVPPGYAEVPIWLALAPELQHNGKPRRFFFRRGDLVSGLMTVMQFHAGDERDRKHDIDYIVSCSQRMIYAHMMEPQ